MRETIYRMDRAGADALLARAPLVHVAWTALDGQPVLRAVHGAVVDGAIAFDGAPAREAMHVIGRPAVISAEETIADIPSWFIDPDRAPATRFCLSAQVRGRIEQVGGSRMVRVPLVDVEGKAELGQNRRPAELVRVLERIWQRGLAGDPRAIDLVRAANPAVPDPTFVTGPPGVRLWCALDATDVAGGLRMLEGAYWLDGVAQTAIAEALIGSQAWVGARDESGALVAMARAAGDRARMMWIYDVVVAPAWRGRGLGKAMVRLILDHPAVRRARKVRLATRDAHALYSQFGFRSLDARTPYPEMVLDRDAA